MNESENKNNSKLNFQLRKDKLRGSCDCEYEHILKKVHTVNELKPNYFEEYKLHEPEIDTPVKKT